MLPTQELEAARIDISFNTLLRDLWKAVEDYNKTFSSVGGAIAKFEAKTAGRTSDDTHRHIRAMALQKVMLAAGAYLTSKPPQSSKSGVNHLRWDAIQHLAEAAAKQADAIGVKLAVAPADARQISGDKGKSSVWLEIMDPMHRDQGMLSVSYGQWLTDANAVKNQTSFWAYGDAALDAKIEAYVPQDVGKRLVLYDHTARSLTEIDRTGKMIDSHGVAIDTMAMESLHTGRGWGIFVYDTQRRLFVSDHSAAGVEELIRHTTLSTGAPVVGAGEIAVEKGRIVAVSNETGHYQLPFELFFKFLAEAAMIPNDAVIKVFDKPLGKDAMTLYATCGEVRAGGGGPVAADIWRNKSAKDESGNYKFKDAVWAQSKAPQVEWSKTPTDAQPQPYAQKPQTGGKGTYQNPLSQTQAQSGGKGGYQNPL